MKVYRSLILVVTVMHIVQRYMGKVCVCVCVCAHARTLSVPGGTSGKEPACQCRTHKRLRFDPWVGKIPCWRAWQPTPVFWPGESPWTEEPGRLWSVGSQRVRHE